MLTPNLNMDNRHHFPKLGAIVGVNLPRRPDQEHRYRKFQVVSFPGVDTTNQFNPRANAHLVNLQALDNGWECAVAHQWLEELEP